MIRCTLGSQPASFKSKVRDPGLAWLKKNPNPKRPRAYWRACIGQLATAFSHRCAYLAMNEDNGTVDHYLSWKNNPTRAYSWSNYRYVTGRINSAKQAADAEVLDPLDVQDDWFEIVIPSLELVLTAAVPPSHRTIAENTLRLFKLDRGPSVIKQRTRWLCSYVEGIPLNVLANYAPLLARAIRNQPGQALPPGLVTKLKRIIARRKP